MSDFLEKIKKKLKLSNNMSLGIQHVCFSGGGFYKKIINLPQVNKQVQGLCLGPYRSQCRSL